MVDDIDTELLCKISNKVIKKTIADFNKSENINHKTMLDMFHLISVHRYLCNIPPRDIEKKKRDDLDVYR